MLKKNKFCRKIVLSLSVICTIYYLVTKKYNSYGKYSEVTFILIFDILGLQEKYIFN